MVPGFMSDTAVFDIDRFADDLRALASKTLEIAAVWIFGSAVRGALRFDSDVDVAVLFRRGVQDRDRLLAAFGARLEKFTASYPVDAVDLEPQGVIFAHAVLSSGRRVYDADRDQRVDFESTTCVRAFDFRPTHDLAVRGQREGIQRRLRELRP